MMIAYLALATTLYLFSISKPQIPLMKAESCEAKMICALSYSSKEIMSEHFVAIIFR